MKYSIPGWQIAALSPIATLSAVTIGTGAIATEANPIGESHFLAQVTSVSQLSDVQPTDWAFQALQSLVERYGCIAGYPDSTYRGNRAITRYEFAAGLNACLDRLLSQVGLDSDVSEEDLATLRRLQEEFAAELATLRGRVDALETRTAELEANQFSTTTQLRGEVGFAVSSVFGNEKPGGESLDNITVLNNRVRLFLNTRFSENDLLVTRLDALNVIPFGPGEGDEPNITGTSMTRTAFDEGSDNSVRIGKLFYSFSLGNSGDSGDDHDHDHDHGHGHGHGASGGPLTVLIDAVGGEFNENFVNFNEFFSEELTGAVSRFGRYNPIYYQGLEGTGASLNYDLGDAASLSVGYLAPNASNPEQKNGLFNGSYAALGQLALFPTDDLRFGLTYVRAYYPGEEVVVSGETGSELANAPFGEEIATAADHFGFNTSFAVSPSFSISGWAGLSLAHAAVDGLGVSEGDDASIFNWAVTLAFPDLGSQGSLGGLIVGQPPRILDNDGGADAEEASWHLEAQYRYQLNDNIAINPGVFVVLNPENADNETIWVGTIRTIFQF